MRLSKKRDALEVAGIEQYLKFVQTQVDAYVDSHPEAMKRFAENREAVDAYNKANPHKTNPKDYK